MPGTVDEQHSGSTASMAPDGAAEVTEALKHGPRGALFLSSIAVAILFVGWLAFYFFLFLPRGDIG